MTKPPPNVLSLERIDHSHDSGVNGLFMLAIALLVGGAGAMLALSGGYAVGAGGGAILAALLIYGYLLRATPATRYFRYFWTDEQGMHYRADNNQQSRITSYRWQDIETAVRANSDTEDFTGIQLYLHRTGMRGVPVHLEMASDDDTARAIQLIDNNVAAP